MSNFEQTASLLSFEQMRRLQTANSRVRRTVALRAERVAGWSRAWRHFSRSRTKLLPAFSGSPPEQSAKPRTLDAHSVSPMAPFLDAKALKAALSERDFNERVILAVFAAVGVLTARLAPDVLSSAL